MPFHGSGLGVIDKYEARSVMVPGFNLCIDMRLSLNYQLLRSLVDEWRQIAGYIQFGDYYPLTTYSFSNGDWLAWQFDRPEIGEGIVQAFRRADCTNTSMVLKLRGLDFAALYEITNFDVPGMTVISGSAAMKDGLNVTITTQPGSTIIKYKKM